MEHFAKLAHREREKIQIEHPTRLNAHPIIISPHRIIDPSSTAVVSDLIYGGFLEHMGRCIYGGLIDDPKAPSPAELLVAQPDGKPAWRKDVMEILGPQGSLPTPILRWPGGNFASNYHWQDGIGPIEDRPGREELAWKGHVEPNTFGTDEYIAYCRANKIEPYICFNFGTGTFQEAMNWVEYCNGTSDTYWTRLREKNTGSKEPHNVKYWGLGNEIYGSYQIGNMTPDEYIKTARRWAHGVRLVDPKVKLIACGLTGGTEWDKEIIAGLLKCTDHVSIHAYSSIGHTLALPSGMEYEVSVFSPNLTESQMEMGIQLINLAKSHKQLPGDGPTGVLEYFKTDAAFQAKPFKLCLDEWNVWDEKKLTGAQGLEQSYDYSDALAMCSWFNILIRKSSWLEMACMAQTVNVISHIVTKPDGVLLQASFYPCSLFATHMKGGRVMDIAYVKDYCTGRTFPSWVQHMAPPPYVDIVGLYFPAEDGKPSTIKVSIVNKHPNSVWEAPFSLEGFKVADVEIHTLYNDDLQAKNTWEAPKTVIPTVTTVSGDQWSGVFPVKKHSWSLFIFKGQE